MPLDLSGNGILSGVDIAGSGLGKILQIVRATDGTTRTTTSTSFVDANISVTITPTKSTSVVLIIWSSYPTPFGGSGNYQNMRITDSSNISVSGAESGRAGTNNSGLAYSTMTLIGYATPATTSAVSYKGRYQTISGTTARLSNDAQTGQLYAIEVSA